MLTGFKFDGDEEWKGGDIYDPESGKTYTSYMYLKDTNTLKVRGFIGIPYLVELKHGPGRIDLSLTYQFHL